MRWVQLCSSLSILWHCLSLGLEWKLTFSSPVATVEFSKFAGILSAALSRHHLSGFEIAHMYAAAKSLQSCLTLWDPIDGSPPGSPVPGILQARTLEWVAISFSNAWKWSHSVMSDSSRPHGLQPTRLLRPWDFSRQEYWNELPLPSLCVWINIYCAYAAISWRNRRMIVNV